MNLLATKGVKASFSFYIGVCWTPVCHGASVHAQKTTLLSFSVNQTCFHHVRCSNHKASCHFTVNRDSWRSCSFAVCHVHVISHDFLSVAKHLSSLYAPGQNEVGATLEIAGDGSKIDYQWAQQIDHL